MRKPRKPRRKPAYLSVTAMHDGTVLAARPIRKPHGAKPDADSVCDEYAGNYVNSFPSYDEGRFRFFDIMANRLNTRRAIRELVLPRLEALEAQMVTLGAMLERIEELDDTLTAQ